MSGRRTVIGLCMLCALAISAVAAQGASAAGTTAYTCKKGLTGFNDSQCKTIETPGSYGHETIPAKTKTELSGSGGVAKLTSVKSGIKLTLESKKQSGSGTMTNEEAGGEMFVHGTGTIKYEEVTVTAPAGKGCEVAGGTVTTEPLTATTAGQGMFLKFTPETGTVFAHFNIINCSTASFNTEYKAEGSVKGVPTGTETVFTHAETTEQGTLTLGGQKAGIEGALSLTARANSGEGFTPLAATT